MDLSNLDSNHGLGSMANSYCIPPKDNSLQSTKEFTDGKTIGGIHEIYDSKKPFEAKGAIQQAWSVAEVFRIIIENQ